MKKIIYLVMVSMAFAMPAAAQSPIQYGDGCYLYNPINLSDSWAVLMPGGTNYQAYISRGYNMLGYEYILSAPTTIYGIAVTGQPEWNGPVYLYHKVNDSVVFFDSINKHSRVKEFMYSALHEGKIVNDTVSSYEYIFPEPITLSDTIYIGGKPTTPGGTGSHLYVVWDGTYSQHWVNFLFLNDSVFFYYTDFDFCWGGFFPIIKNGCDSCITVQDMRFTKVGNSAAIAQWDTYADHNDWLLCYGPQGFTPDSGQAVGTVTPQRALTGLSPTDHYDVYVKAHCSCCGSEEWTPWAGPFDLCLSEIGIDEVQAPEVTLAPNPTTGTLTVGCEATIEEVELYDMQGRCVQSRACIGSTAVLDLTALPAGSYVLVAHTAQGLATRTVEKR